MTRWKIKRVVWTALSMCLLIGQHAVARPVQISDLDGASVQIQLDDESLCVERRVLLPLTLQGALDNPGIPLTVFGTSGARTTIRSSVDISLLGFSLTAPDDAAYQQLLDLRDRKKQALAKPALDWIRVQFIPIGFANARNKIALAARLKDFEPVSTSEVGFTSHKRLRTCVGTRVGAGCCVGVEYGPDCLETSLKYGHPSDPNVVIFCGKSTCSVLSPVLHAGIHYQYDFPRSFLVRWPALHADIAGRIERWRNDQSCVD